MSDAKRMADETKASLKIDRYMALHGIHGPWSCLQCGTGIRKPRYLKDMSAGGKRMVLTSFCSQECLDGWVRRFHLPPTRWEKYNQDGLLIGYVVPKKGFVSLQEIEDAQLAKEGASDDAA